MNCGWTYWNSHSFQVSHTITPLNNCGNTSFSLFQQYQNHEASHVQEFMRFIRESNTMHEDIICYYLFPRIQVIHLGKCCYNDEFVSMKKGAMFVAIAMHKFCNSNDFPLEKCARVLVSGFQSN